VWRADLADVTNDLIELLCTEERMRAERILGERDRQLWARSHGVLRALLGRYLQKDPRTLRFGTGAHGKPALLDDTAGSTATTEPTPGAFGRLCFNLSHSGHIALYAVSGTRAVGVDVEIARRPIDELAIAARTFGAAETRRLQGLDPAIREEEFRRTWVRHEAVLKCTGAGIGGGSARARPSEPWIAELDMGAGAAAAVAVERPARELRCWDSSEPSPPASV
jgi:4'-phosphopantetheinyl transferase